MSPTDRQTRPQPDQPAGARSNQVLPFPSPVPVASVQGTLALDLQPRHEPPPRAHRHGRPPGEVITLDRAARRDLEQWSRRYAQAAVEIVGGDRPASQLLRWSSRRVYTDLQRRAQLVARAGHHLPGQGRVQPVRPQVRGVHTSFVSPDVAEVSVHVRYGHRSRALAARFERRGDRWLCTALEFA
ncbi:Rv3235 family protein [Nocardioides panaciterrulae]|uniref:Uncharacterized protein n=1 Tax=Nocardioides panaciterrulae TaxID=661492 RepID=A0A7Y9E4I3_9ACTN|nr:Rv3235 family protein [Nocardioides panaciterrulae]NYD40965.1 hypothetical protein [Nocardioides panaciterrulae]